LFAIVVATLFLAMLCVGAARGTLPAAVPALYVVASIAAAVAYATDKSAAERGAWRTRERTLHLVALIGGWPGALIAQTLLRHKTRKPSFRFAFWATVVLNCGVLAWVWYRR
jgi:uncharacterized membrane protein YsdA (DUF1294 family)